ASGRDAARWLTSAGFEIVAARGLAEALEAATAAAPDVVLTDMALRDVTGAGVCRVLRDHAALRAVPLIALCANRREAATAAASGASEVLERPYDWRVACLRVARLVDVARTTRELARAREEAEQLRRALEDERRERTWRDQFDPLTGLPASERFERTLASALATATPSSQVAVALVDIEKLVLINSRLGRGRANSVLQQVAQRLITGLRSDEILRPGAMPTMSMAARVGGGLFAVMVTALPRWEEARAAVTLLLDRVSGRYLAGGEEVFLSASAGVALAPADGLTVDTLMQKAELAASDAVATGGGLRLYEQSSQRLSERSREIIRLLPRAMANGEIRVHYQPLVDGSLGAISGGEALLRWESPQLGTVTPTEFVPLAEESGLMVDIGTWVLRTAVQQARAWIDEGLTLHRIAVNVSLCQLVRGDLAQVVRDALDAAKLDPSLLELELSERGVLRSDAEILRQLRAIRELGVRLAIDDFGTGNSAVAYLKQFPIDVLKIDQSFVRGLHASSEDAAITSATIAMARKLGLRVVAEGVEEQVQMDFLREHGCREYQGFLFSPAVPADDFASLLRRGLGHAGARPVPHEERRS
ncbi:MAG TPA: EAL domain-containing protein, partial [Vicinamibacteria bacterium]